MWDAAVYGNEARGDVRRGAVSPEAAGGAGQETAPPEEQRPPETDQWTPGREEETQPTLWEMMQEAREKAEEMREKFRKLKPPVNYGDIPIQAYARLNRARTRGDVGVAQGYARRQIARLKAALRQDPDSKDVIRGAITQLQKAVYRGDRKKNQLDRERLVQVQRRKAEERRQAREELRLRQELKRRMLSRYLQEAGYMNEAVIDQQMRSAMAAEAAKWQQAVPQQPAATPAQGAAAYSAAVAAQAEPIPVEGGVEAEA